MVINCYHDLYKEDSTLRSYQDKAKKEIFESWDEVDNVMFQMPTGTGKTRLFTSIIRDINDYSKLRREPVKILIIAHRTELIDQIDESLTKYCVPHNVIAGGRDRNYKFPVNVASIQTITHPNNLNAAKKLDIQFIIIDEAHHALAATYKKLWKLYPESKKLGVTATPWRMNHQSFLDLFDKLVLSMPIKDFINQGFLAPYKYFSLRSNSDIQRTIDDIELDKFGEYKESSMEEKMDIGSIRAQLLDSYLSLAEGKKGIIYAINIVHAQHICEEYKNAGYIAVSIDSKTPAAERKDLVNKFKKGLIDIIVNVDIFSEGFDCPDIEFIQLARPTRSLVKYLQQVGRGLRPTENKEECIILDNVGMYSRFGLPNARRHWKQHFLGRKVDEEPQKVVSKGTGRSRFVDLSEGTEDMELIQDINEEQADVLTEESNVTSSAINDFFPIFGVTLGKTTCDEAHELGYNEMVDDDTGGIFFDIENVLFSYTDSILDEIYWRKDNRDFPDLWKSKGFSWDNSYDKWLDTFQRLGYRIDNQEPEKFMCNGSINLDYSFKAISPDGTLAFYMNFDSVEVGSLPNSLSYIDVYYYKVPIDSWDVPEEENEEEEAYSPIRTLEYFHFVCDNFIFFLKQSKKIYEAYIQDDTYFIISELMLDRRDQCFRRIRVGKIPSDSWMFWQMLREKVDNLKTIVHYGANYTLFHYKVLSKENTIKDKYFDYKGREIDDPNTVKAKYDQAASEGIVNDYIDVPVSKASFKITYDDKVFYILRTLKGVTKPIAKILANSNFGQSYYSDLAFENLERMNNGLPELKRHHSERLSVIRSDDNSFTVKKYEKGKGYLLKYDLKGKLLHTGTLAVAPTVDKVTLPERDIAKLKHVFDSKATSYKYFWFLSILQIYKENQITSIPFRQILVRMVSNAWKYVFIENGRFSQSDQLPIYLKDIQVKTKLSRKAKESEVETKVNKEFHAMRFESLLTPLLKNVPYRFLSPWIPFTSNEDVIEKSYDPDTRCLYEIYKDHITINDLWSGYLMDHYEEIVLLIETGLKTYLKLFQSFRESEVIYEERFPSFNQLLKEMHRKRNVEAVKLFYIKYNLPLSRKLTPNDILDRIPESNYTIDKDGHKHIDVAKGQWSLKTLDKLLSK